MAQYNGYRKIAHSSYDEWKRLTEGNGYDVDYQWGNQCWDYCALLWYQYNLPLVTRSGGGGAADCWIISKNVNARGPFIAIEGITNVKRGDILVWNRGRYHSAGHIAIADEDYNPNHNYIYCLGQNQGKGQYYVAYVEKVYNADFLGIFRNTEWDQTPPPGPEPEPKDNKIENEFPWAVAWNHWENFK